MDSARTAGSAAAWAPPLQGSDGKRAVETVQVSVDPIQCSPQQKQEVPAYVSWPSIAVDGETPGGGLRKDTSGSAKLTAFGGLSVWVTETNVLYVTAAAVVALSVVDLCLRFLAPCPFHDIAFDLTCRSHARRIHWVGVAKYNAGLWPTLGCIIFKCVRVLRLQQQLLPPWLAWVCRVPGVRGPLPSNHWSMLATRSFFVESVASVKTLHLLVVLVQLPSLVFTGQQVRTPYCDCE
jgi:hypothetical protein